MSQPIFTLKDYYARSRSLGYETSTMEIETANILLDRVNILVKQFINETNYNKLITLTSGHRTASYNKSINGAPQSLHIVSKAIDLSGKQIAEWYVSKGFDYWQKIKLSVEDPKATPTWSHFDIGLRVDRRESAINSNEITQKVYRSFIP